MPWPSVCMSTHTTTTYDVGLVWEYYRGTSLPACQRKHNDITSNTTLQYPIHLIFLSPIFELARNCFACSNWSVSIYNVQPKVIRSFGSSPPHLTISKHCPKAWLQHPSDLTDNHNAPKWCLYLNPWSVSNIWVRILFHLWLTHLQPPGSLHHPRSPQRLCPIVFPRTILRQEASFSISR